MQSFEEHFVLEICGQHIPTRIIRERRRSVRASIGKDAAYLRLPLLMPMEMQQQQIGWFKAWLEKQALKHPDVLARFIVKTYTDGDTLTVGNRSYTLRIAHSDKVSSSGRLTDGVIYLRLSQENANVTTIPTLLSRIVAQDFLPEITRRVQELNERFFRQTVRSVKLKYNHSNWGSCSGHGNLNFSTRLLFAPDVVRDYVIVHELAHLIEPNHSDRFWKLVADAMPDYPRQEQWLRDQAHWCRF